MKLKKRSGEEIVVTLRDEIEGNLDDVERHSKFDEVLIETWKSLHETPGVFRYPLVVREERHVSGRFRFLLQLNLERHILRRTPEDIESIRQPFNEDRFNFLKVRPEEIMFELCDVHNNKNQEYSGRHPILVNVSPIDSYHSLFCPFVDDRLPQIITAESLELACSIMFLSDNRYLRVAFNSLGGMASVNHLHYHLIYVKFELPIETMECRPLTSTDPSKPPLAPPPPLASASYPAPCFCFEVRRRDALAAACAGVARVAALLADRGVAHNLMATRGVATPNAHENGEETNGGEEMALRICLWPRRSALRAKDATAFNLAVCEFSGHLPVKTEEDYRTLTYESIASLLEEETAETFEMVRDDVVALFK